ncbi:MAG: nitroreductase family protein [Acidimicrobiales bacterium]
MADFFDVVMRQRACRSYREDAVEDDLVEKVLDAATHAPSAENRQPWVFVVVRDADLRRAIGSTMRSAWEEGGRAFSEGRLPPRLLDEVDRGAKGDIAAAPVLVVVCGDSTRALELTLPSSVYLAAQNLLLAAGALGLGSAMTTLATVSPAPLQEILALPDHVRPMAVVPLGWPSHSLGRPRRLPAGELTFRDRYGNRW